MLNFRSFKPLKMSGHNNSFSHQPHRVPVASRREFLNRAGAGFGSLALAALLAGDRAGASDNAAKSINPIAAKPPHFASRAKSVIWCFLDGGPSHIDLFDPKPALNKLAGKPLPDSFERPITAMGKTAYTPLLASQRKFAQHGQSGIWVSDWYPEIATCADDMAVIRSCQADGLNHVGSICQMNTGSILGGRPSPGRLVACMVWEASATTCPATSCCSTITTIRPAAIATGALASCRPLTRARNSARAICPILHVAPPGTPCPSGSGRSSISSKQLNRQHQASRSEDDNLEARIAAYELAYRMQAAAPEAVDLAGETAETQQLYGLDQKETSRNGRNCLLARRLVERGVRFVQLYMGSGSKWDAHSDLEGNHSQHCRESDRPIAGLLKDLKRRGLLDSTLVIWGGEFGRTPMSESGNGRDHNPYGFTIWMAGGGIRGGVTYGATDEIGLYAVENKAHVHDIHATILHLLGLESRSS